MAGGGSFQISPPPRSSELSISKNPDKWSSSSMKMISGLQTQPGPPSADRACAGPASLASPTPTLATFSPLPPPEFRHVIPHGRGLVGGAGGGARPRGGADSLLPHPALPGFLSVTWGRWHPGTGNLAWRHCSVPHPGGKMESLACGRLLPGRCHAEGLSEDSSSKLGRNEVFLPPSP